MLLLEITLLKVIVLISFRLRLIYFTRRKQHDELTLFFKDNYYNTTSFTFKTLLPCTVKHSIHSINQLFLCVMKFS